MKRNFKLIAAVLVLAVMALTLASCEYIEGTVGNIKDSVGNVIDKIVPHEHEFSADWSSDATNHWHAAICDKKDECASATADLAAHTFADGVCSVCGYYEPNSTLTVVEANAWGETFSHNAYTSDKYYVTGVITEVYNPTYGNMYIADEDGNTLTIYGTYSADGSTKYSAMDYQPIAGDTVTIYGIIGQYNGTAQIKNGWITEVVMAECDHVWAAADCTTPATCTLCGRTTGKPLPKDTILKVSGTEFMFKVP